MIVSKDGFLEPHIGQSVYVIMKDGRPQGVCLRYPRAVMEMAEMSEDVDLAEVPWYG